MVDWFSSWSFGRFSFALIQEPNSVFTVILTDSTELIENKPFLLKRRLTIAWLYRVTEFSFGISTHIGVSFR